MDPEVLLVLPRCGTRYVLLRLVAGYLPNEAVDAVGYGALADNWPPPPRQGLTASSKLRAVASSPKSGFVM